MPTDAGRCAARSGAPRLWRGGSRRQRRSHVSVSRETLLALTERYGLEAEAAERLELLLAALGRRGGSADDRARAIALRSTRTSPTASPGCELEPLRSARRIADLGAGAGFPGLVLAIALPGAQVDLVESAGRKAAVIERLARAARVENARAVIARAEEWAAAPPALGGGREAYDVVTARALAPLAVLVEYASPLLADQGVLVAWKGARDADEERARRRSRGARWACDSRRSGTWSRSPAPSIATCTCCARSRPRQPGSRAVPGWRASGRWPDLPALPCRTSEFGPERKERAGRFRPGAPIVSLCHGKRHRSRKSEGRGRQDHDRGQPRRVDRRRGLSDAARRPRPTVQRNGCTWTAEAGRPERLRLPRRRSRPHRRRGPERLRSPRRRAVLARPRRRQRRAAAHRRLGDASCATGSGPCASATC